MKSALPEVNLEGLMLLTTDRGLNTVITHSDGIFPSQLNMSLLM